MTKIVLNKVYGGFTISYKAALLLEKYSNGKYKFSENELNDGKKLNNIYCSDFVDKYSFRTDPALIKVVEELGTAASGNGSCLVIQEFDETEPHYFNEYDGIETIDTSRGFLIFD